MAATRERNQLVDGLAHGIDRGSARDLLDRIDDAPQQDSIERRESIRVEESVRSLLAACLVHTSHYPRYPCQTKRCLAPSCFRRDPARRDRGSVGAEERIMTRSQLSAWAEYNSAFR